MFVEETWLELVLCSLEVSPLSAVASFSVGEVTGGKLENRQRLTAFSLFMLPEEFGGAYSRRFVRPSVRPELVCIKTLSS